MVALALFWLIWGIILSVAAKKGMKASGI